MRVWTLERVVKDQWRAVGVYLSQLAAQHAARTLQQEAGWSDVIDWEREDERFTNPILGHRFGSRFDDWRVQQFELRVREEDAG